MAGHSLDPHPPDGSDSPRPPCPSESRLLSACGSSTGGLQRAPCLISLEGYCSKGIYFRLSVKKMYTEIPPKHIYMFLLEADKALASKKPRAVINLWGFIQVSLGIWTCLKWLSDKAE